MVKEIKLSDDEVIDEIETALKDARGINSHQKRLAFCLSFGISNLIENYLRKNNVLKQGHRIDHQWFKRKKENVKEILLEKSTVSLEKLTKLDKLLDVAYKIETKRNDLAYGGLVSETTLKVLIDDFLGIRNEVENE